MAVISQRPLIIPVRDEIDVFKARRAGRELARDLGFSSRDYAAVEIAVSELAANIVRHAGSGTITIAAITDGLEIVAEDQGPGFPEPAIVCRPRKWGEESLGIGLAGVRRLMDEVEISSTPGQGARVVARLWREKPARLLAPRQDFPAPRNGLLDYGVISTSRYGAEHNGDAFVIHEFARQALIAVIDGLGHGEAASLPARKAAGYVRDHCREGLASIIEGCHRLLLGSRGAVMGLVRLELDGATLTCAGVGNIRVAVAGQQPARPHASPGIVGHTLPPVREERFPYRTGDTIFVYSDGISDRFAPAALQAAGKSVQEMAELAAREFGRDEDDVTIIVARERI